MQAAQHRHDGWSPERTATFLDTLSHKGNVRRAAAAIGMSREAAYCRRRRDALFARAWAAAMLLAREEGGHILADRALDGVEEEVWFRGEVVGSRIRYDNRLLLAHIARLDRLALDETAQADAARFDELVACLAAAGDDLPPSRAIAIEQAAQAEADRQEEDAAGGFGEDRWERERREAAERIQQARADAAQAWDTQQAKARAHVDALLQIIPGTEGRTAAAGGDGGAGTASPDLADLDPRTVSTMSTSPQILPGTERGTAAAGGGGGAPPASPDLTDAEPASTVSDLSTSPEIPTRYINRAERRRNGRKNRPVVPNTRSGRHAHPPLQRRS